MRERLQRDGQDDSTTSAASTLIQPGHEHRSSTTGTPTEAKAPLAMRSMRPSSSRSVNGACAARWAMTSADAAQTGIDTAFGSRSATGTRPRANSVSRMPSSETPMP